MSVAAATNHITTLPYDANGNLTSDGANALVYDAENRVVSAANSGASGSYTYDGNGLRVKRVSGSTTTVYIFSGTKVIAEYDNGAAPTAPSREYIYSGGALLAKIDSSGTKYYHQDQLSNRLVTDSSGSAVEQLGTFPFGDSWYNGTSDKLQFSTYERDSESGNDYALARQYVWRLARFTALDPLSGSIGDPQSLNRYTYVRNNPTGLVDPSGMVDCLPGMVENCATTGSGTPTDGSCSAGPDGSLHCYYQDRVTADPVTNPAYVGPSIGGGNQPFSIGGGGAERGGGDGSTANSRTKTPWYKNSCITNALGKGAFHIAIDAIGLIPEGGLVSRAVGNFAGYRGIVATQQGTKAIQAVKTGTGISSTGVGSNDTSGTGVIGTGLGVAGIVSTLAGATPVVGQVLSGVSIGLDAIKVGMDISNCR